MEGLLNELHPATLSTIPATFRLSWPIPHEVAKTTFPPTIPHEVVAKTGEVVSQCHRRNDSLAGKAKRSGALCEI